MKRETNDFFEKYKKIMMLLLLFLISIFLVISLIEENYGWSFTYMIIILFYSLVVISSYVDEKSIRLKHYKRINQDYRVKRRKYSTQTTTLHKLNSKRQIESVNVRDKAIQEYIEENEGLLKRNLEKIEENRHLEKEYKKEVNKIYKLSQVDKFKFIEDYKLQLNRLEFQTRLQIIFHFQYTSPKGQNRYDLKERYDKNRLIEALEELEEAKKSKSAREIERSKMTSKLRYDILHRDNFTCQLCGATQSHGTTLHVDHIHPVAKGGLTEEANLRTLCADCNLEKGDQIEYNTPK